MSTSIFLLKLSIYSKIIDILKQTIVEEKKFRVSFMENLLILSKKNPFYLDKSFLTSPKIEIVWIFNIFKNKKRAFSSLLTLLLIFLFFFLFVFFFFTVLQFINHLLKRINVSEFFILFLEEFLSSFSILADGNSLLIQQMKELKNNWLSKFKIFITKTKDK